MFVVYEEVNGVKWYLVSFETEAGAKRSVTCKVRNQKKHRAAFNSAGKSINPVFGYMSAEDWKNRTVPMKKVHNLISGKEIEIPADTPACCDPSTETYWSM